MTNRLGTTGMVLALFSVMVLAGCVSGGTAPPTITPVAAEKPVPALQSMKVSLVPKVREMPPALESVSYEPAQGLVLQHDGPFTLRVIATGTGDHEGAAWLERDGKVLGKTALRYERARDEYTADIRLGAGKVSAGDYDVRAVLESTDPVSAPEPLHVSFESILDPAVIAEVEGLRPYFDTDVYVLRDRFRQEIESIIAKLQPLAARIESIRVEGHCDTRGTEVHNTELGANRAASVAKVLGDLLPGVVIGVQSLGSENPDPPGDNPADWAKNRWARIRIRSR